jgi:ACR3 family arsenite transporter
MNTSNAPPGKAVAKPSISVFERYLTVWVRCASSPASRSASAARPVPAIGRMEVAQVNLPVGLLIWVMIIPMLVKVDFGACTKCASTSRHRRHAVVNWLVKPFSMALLGWLFIRHLFAPMLPRTNSTATSPA